MNQSEFLEFSKVLYKTFFDNDEKIQDPETQNITLTFSPEALLTILICVGAADDEAVQRANVLEAYRVETKPASTISLYHSLRSKAKEAGVIS